MNRIAYHWSGSLSPVSQAIHQSTADKVSALDILMALHGAIKSVAS